MTYGEPVAFRCRVSDYMQRHSEQNILGTNRRVAYSVEGDESCKMLEGRIWGMYSPSQVEELSSRVVAENCFSLAGMHRLHLSKNSYTMCMHTHRSLN